MRRLLSLGNLTAFFGGLSKHYLGVFFLGIFLSQPSWRLLWATLLALILSHLIINLRQQFSSWLTFAKMYQGSVKDWKYRKFVTKERITIKRYTLAQYLDVDSPEEFLSSIFIHPGHKIFHNSIEEAIRIFDVRNEGMDTSGSKPLIRTNLVCYARPMAVSYIYVKAAPHEFKKPVDKMKVYHELGHFLISPLYLKHKRNGGVIHFLLLLCFIFIITDLRSIPVVLLLGYILCLLVVALSWFFAWLPNGFKDEVYADLFSIYCLSPEERQQVLDRFSSKRYNYMEYFRNKKMLTPQIKKRFEMFMRNLQLATGGDVNGMIAYTYDVVEQSMLYTFFKNAGWVLFFVSLGTFAKRSFSLPVSTLYWAGSVALLLLIAFFRVNQFCDKQAQKDLSILEYDL